MKISIERFVFFCFCLLLNVCFLAAQNGTVEGRILDDEFGEGLIGANVLYGKGKGTITDFDGNFKFDLAPGTYTISVSYVGYQSQEQIIDVVAGETQTLKFKMKSDQLLDEVVVVADIAKERETPIAFSNVPTAKINEELAAQDLPMVLNSTPGVYATETGGGDGDARITIRGFNQRNIAVMLDGIPVNDMENGWVYWSNWFGLDLVTKTMQVQRGLGASKLAVPSIGGTINILTKGIESKKSVQLRQEVGNNGYLRTTFGITTGRLKGGWGISAAGSYKQGDGWVNGNFTQGAFYYLRVDKELGKHMLSLSGFGAPQKHGQRPFTSRITNFSNDYARKIFDGTDAEYDLLQERSFTKEQIRALTVFVTPENQAAAETYQSRLNQIDSELQAQGFMDEDGRLDPNHPVQYNYIDTVNSLNSGLQYNSFVGTRNGEEYNVRQNYYHKPQFSLRHTWTPNPRFILSNLAYLSIGNGGGVGPDGSIIYSQIENSPGVLRTSINNHFWYGLLTTGKFDISENWMFSAGLDLRNYRGDHWREIFDLLGNESFTSENNTRVESGKQIYEGDRYSYDYSGFVQWGGAFALLEYKTKKFSAFFNLSGNSLNYGLEDFMKPKVVNLPDTTLYISAYDIYDGSDLFAAPEVTYNGKTYNMNSPEAENQKIDDVNLSGYTVKGGAKYNLSKNMNVFFNTGYLSKPQRYSNAIFTNTRQAPHISPLAFKDIENEKVFAIEVGYGFKSRKFSGNVNLYNTQWNNKPLDNPPTVSEDPEDPDADRIPINVSGIAALHRGVEIDFAYKPNKMLSIEGLASIGDWIWNSNATAVIPGGDTLRFDPKGVHVGDAAQHQLGGLIRVEPIKGFYVKLKGTYFGKNFSAFQPESLQGENAGRESWKIPSYSIFSFHTGYKFKFKGVRMEVRGNILNLLNSEYISDARNNDTFASPSEFNFDASSSTVFFGQGRRWSTSLKISL